MEDNREYGKHESVLLRECIDSILEAASLEDTEWVADLTFGAGGHSFTFLEENPRIRLLSFDQDLEAINNGKKRILDKNYQDRIFLCHSNFENFKEVVEKDYPEILKDHGGFLGILMDLGVSSHQFDEGGRGFSFRFDGALDMRMNPGSGDISAKEVVNTFLEKDIADIIYKYGEEGFSRTIAKNIVETRKHKQIETTKELENIVFHSYPSKMRKGRIHPATKTFQALRLFVNRELEVLENTLERAASMLKTGGHFSVISFHSLEDRIVKHEFRRFQKEIGGYKVLTKKPILPKNDEIKRNFRARSAKLRVLESI